MLRFLLVCFSVVGYLILFIPALLIFWPLHKFFPKAIDYISLRMVQAVFRLCLFFAGVKLTVIGKENIPTDQAVLYVGNHSSFFDILITYVQSKRLLGFIAKKSMLKIPLLSHWMRRVHCLFIDRENVKEGLKIIISAIDKIKAGVSIFIFPEGTRAENPDEMLPFKDGSFKIAEKSGALIIPVTLVNASAIFEAQAPRVKRSHVVVEYGKAIDFASLEKEQKKAIGSYVQSIIRETYTKNKGLL